MTNKRPSLANRRGLKRRLRIEVPPNNHQYQKPKPPNNTQTQKPKPPNNTPKPNNNYNSMLKRMGILPTMHTGGLVRKTAPHRLLKGEVVLSRGQRRGLTHGQIVKILKAYTQ